MAIPWAPSVITIITKLHNHPCCSALSQKCPCMCNLVCGQSPRRDLPFFFSILVTMPSWIEITTWAFAAIGFLNTLKALIINYAPTTRIGKWFRTPAPPQPPILNPPSGGNSWRRGWLRQRRFWRSSNDKMLYSGSRCRL